MAKSIGTFVESFKSGLGLGNLDHVPDSVADPSPDEQLQDENDEVHASTLGEKLDQKQAKKQADRAKRKASKPAADAKDTKDANNADDPDDPNDQDSNDPDWKQVNSGAGDNGSNSNSSDNDSDADTSGTSDPDDASSDDSQNSATDTDSKNSNKRNSRKTKPNRPKKRYGKPQRSIEQIDLARKFCSEEFEKDVPSMFEEFGFHGRLDPRLEEFIIEAAATRAYLRERIDQRAEELAKPEICFRFVGRKGLQAEGESFDTEKEAMEKSKAINSLVSQFKTLTREQVFNELFEIQYYWKYPDGTEEIADPVAAKIALEEKKRKRKKASASSPGLKGETPPDTEVESD